ncbi:tRNA uridine 5-carboxymethylaminomethyl modification enzyme MnmG [Eufriesea mexicana]|nr:tRNA uridine 5-carboxymethylaminomethyl modification enzyme MnmG [Eufriesea mexicana]
MEVRRNEMSKVHDIAIEGDILDRILGGCVARRDERKRKGCSFVPGLLADSSVLLNSLVSPLQGNAYVGAEHAAWKNPAITVKGSWDKLDLPLREEVHLAEAPGCLAARSLVTSRGPRGGGAASVRSVAAEWRLPIILHRLGINLWIPPTVTVAGITLENREKITNEIVILTIGTYMTALTLQGYNKKSEGPDNQRTSNGTSEQLGTLGFNMICSKTGTPPRVKKDYINFSKTNIELDKSSTCSGIGPRYCPSIEDNIGRFTDKSRHQIFLKSKLFTLDSINVQDLLTLMPIYMKDKMLRTLPGLENREI